MADQKLSCEETLNGYQKREWRKPEVKSIRAGSAESGAGSPEPGENEMQ